MKRLLAPMSLTGGDRIGAYEITGALGAGGMGEVYRARDTRLKRDVALKILPESFAADPERLARFQREAEVLASLNHPNIATIYGLEEGPAEAGHPIRALVMEVVGGETLADRIARGPIPIDETLAIARQIAEAVEAAHEEGIVHRDLKPANVKVRPDGTVKVLDFGLAKALGQGAGRDVGPAGSKDPAYVRDATASPTITSPAMMTGVGMLLGTAAYMSPEQAKGRPADKRSDIWAFGCVVYEMLTGQRAFHGEDVSETLAMVLMKDVDWSPLPATTPASIRTLLRRCLQKDRKRRLPDIGVARLEIDDAPSQAASSAPSDVRSRGGQRLAWAVAAVATVAAIVLALPRMLDAPPAPVAAIRFQVSPPPDALFTASAEPNESQALSPDGKHIAFRVTRDRRLRLALRSFDADQAQELPGTEGVAGGVFWSPDSRFIVFSSDGRLKKIDVAGGPPQVICDLPAGAILGGTWGPDGTILFGLTAGSLGQSGNGLFRVPSGGGAPTPATTLDASRNESLHSHPWFLPDGQSFMYWAVAAPSGAAVQRSINVGSLDGGMPISVGTSDSKAIYANGFLFFVRDTTLLAQSFDPVRLDMSGDPIAIAQNIPSNPTNGSAWFSTSANGMVAYRLATAFAETQLAWFDRSGTLMTTIGDKADQTAIRLSPDQTRVALNVLDPARRTRDIWVHDLTRNLRTRFTFDAHEDWSAVWSPDSRFLAFSADRTGRLDVYRKAADGSGIEELLVESPVNKYVTSWSQDGRFLLFHTGGAGSQTGNDLWVFPLSGERRPRPVLQTPFGELAPFLSPDGRWIAYRSNESGRNEIYVMPFESPSGKWQISTSGGDEPRWRRDGKELFFIAENTIMAAEVDGTGSSFRVGTVRPLFEVNRRTSGYLGFGTGAVYDVTADGQRFLVNVVADEQPEPPPITVLTNWASMLEQR